MRSDFIKTITEKLETGGIKFLSPEFELALIIVKNPLLGFQLCSFVDKYRSEFNPDEIADAVSNLELGPNGTVVLLDRDVPDLHSFNHSSIHEGNTSQNDLSLPLLSFNNINPLVDSFTPALNSTPISTTSKSVLPPPRSPPPKDLPHFPVSTNGFYLGSGFKNLDISSASNTSLARLHIDADKNLHEITNIMAENERKRVGEWLKLHHTGELQPPSLRTYYPEFSEDYLAESFKGEPLPGVYLPGASGMTEAEAFEAYRITLNCEPPTLVALNKFVGDQFELSSPSFDPEVHWSMEPFTPSFFSSLNLPLDSCTGQGSKSDRTTHPYNWHRAYIRLNLCKKLLFPLRQYLADPLLTTVPFSKEVANIFPGLAIKWGSSHLVCRSRPFPVCNSGVYNGRMSQISLINSCCFCKGIYLLPSHWIVFVYYVPDGLAFITNDFIDAWSSSPMVCCAVHFLHRSKRALNGDLKNFSPNL